MFSYFITILLKLPEECREIVTDTTIQFHLPRKHHDCPVCGSTCTYVDRYRLQTLKGIPDTEHVYRYRNRRYRCHDCGKTFSEDRSFIERYQQIPTCAHEDIVKCHGELMTTAHIARLHGVSPTTVTRHFRQTMEDMSKEEHLTGAAVSLDEFRGNVRAKYQVILHDIVHRHCDDVLADRSARTLRETLRRYPQEEREQVTTVSIDLSSFFRNVVEELFPNAEIAADKFHALRLSTNALDAVRVEVQEQLTPSQRKNFRYARNTLLKRWKNLNKYGRMKLKGLLALSERLARAYALKEEYFRLFDSLNHDEYLRRLRAFGEHVVAAGIASFKTVLKTAIQWQEEIWHGIKTGYNNGFTEGCNNTVKVLKRICYGFRNFENFRYRIIYLLNNDARKARRTVQAVL